MGAVLGGDGDFSRNDVLGLGVGDEVGLIPSVLIKNFSSLKLVTAVGFVFTVLEMVVEYILEKD